MFIFLVALGADYNIFVMSRIREAVKEEGMRAGIATAVGRTGGVITSAGIILAGTFAVLTTLPLRDLFQLGFAVMLGHHKYIVVSPEGYQENEHPNAG
jgi:RND superfamily putative drug exporter